ncbi:MAG TPA: hypothetical protein ENI23_12670 [bacterium]|nr:hypothetical protein [bacterium]
MVDYRSLKVLPDTKKILEDMKLITRQSFDEVIKGLIFHAIWTDTYEDYVKDIENKAKCGFHFSTMNKKMWEEANRILKLRGIK